MILVHSPLHPLGRVDEQALPGSVWYGLLNDAWGRDPVTARRTLIIWLVWREGYLSRDGVMRRVEAVLGRLCFGKAAEATFRRDMRAVKPVLESGGFELRYTRRPGSEGYYVPERPRLAPEVAEPIRTALAEVDRHQAEITSRLSPAARLRQAARLSDGLRRIAVERLRERQPGLSPAEAQREIVRRDERLGG